MGHDFFPYYLHRWSLDGPYHFGATTSLIEMPVTWSLDDFPPAEFVLGMNTGVQAPSQMEENWRADFDYAHRDCQGSMFHPSTPHPDHRAWSLFPAARTFCSITTPGTMAWCSNRWAIT